MNSVIRNFIIYITLFSSVISAQTLTVSGSVHDSQNGNTIIGVTVVTVSKTSKAVLGGTATNSSGEFSLKSKISPTDLLVRFSFVGYETKEYDEFQVKNGKIDLGKVSLAPTVMKTSAVVVTAEKPMVEFYIDKEVINMEKVPGSQSGSVSEALRNTGMVDVDPSSNKISLRGNSNVNILIDGKPQPMADDLLSQMPASYIEKVEVITTPSAKDDPEGDAGTINIITKKEKRKSLNGTVSMFAGTQNAGFGSVIVNYRNNKLNLFSSATSYVGKMGRNTVNDKTNIYNPDLHTEHSDGSFMMQGYMSAYKLGMDYDFDTLNTLSLTGNYNKTNGKMMILSQNENYDLAGVPKKSYSVNDDGHGDFNNYTLSGNYKLKFDTKGHELTADAFYSDMINATHDLLTTNISNLPDFPELQKGINDITNKTLILNSDYVNPDLANGKLEFGYKYTSRKRQAKLDNSNYSYPDATYLDLMKISNTFKYIESINAGYFTYTNKIFILEYKLGLRVEDTYTYGVQQVKDSTFRSNYTSWFPSGGLSYKLNELMQIAFNASRKINRPQMEMINPFIKVNKLNNITVGNPKLMPTYTNSYELRFNPILNLYYNSAKGKPSNISTNDKDSVTVNTTINSTASKNYGFELTIPLINEPRFPVKLPSWFNMFTLRTSYNHIQEQGAYLKEIYDITRNTWRFNGNLSFKVWEDITTMFYYNISLSAKDSRYRDGTVRFVGCYISKDFMDKKLQVGINISDIFNAAKQNNETYGSNFINISSSERYKSRNVGISIKYSFNDFTNRQEKNIDDGRDKDGGMFGGTR